MRLHIFSFLFAFQFITTGQDLSINSLRLYTREVDVSESKDTVRISGHWVAKLVSDLPRIPSINSTSLILIKSKMVCYESLACVWVYNDYDEDGYKSQDSPELHSLNVPYEITEWTSNKIVAQSEARAVKIILVIDIVNSTISKQFQAKKSQSVQAFYLK